MPKPSLDAGRFARRVAKRLLRPYGYTIEEIPPPPEPPIPHPLLAHDIDLLIDIGANEGYFGLNARALGYRGRILSFEPLPRAYELLRAKAEGDPDWEVHDRCALGAAPGTAELNITAQPDGGSSSILPMLQVHLDAEPPSEYVDKIEVELITLDSVFDSYRGQAKKVFLKLDVQGYEEEVLEGAKSSLAEIFAVQIELSVISLYEGDKLYQHYFDFFFGQGFLLWSLKPAFEHPQTGRMLQFDATFVRGKD